MDVAVYNRRSLQLRYGAYWICLSIVFVLSGCQTTPRLSAADVVSSVAADRVAQNLVYALVQEPELNPSLTRLLMPSTTDSFGRVLQNRFRDAGYAIQRVANDREPVVVKHSVHQKSASPDIYRYGVTVGSLRAERDYRLDNGQLYPSSQLTITGATPGVRVQLNDGIFGETSARTVADPVAQAVVVPSPRSSVTTLAVKAPDDVSQSTSLSSRLPPPSPSTSAAPLMVKENVYDTQESNFASLWNSYQEIAKEVLIFPNDSLFLGDINKAILKELMVDYNPDTDMYSVIGCSHGRTAIDNGNSVLALGRAHRVKEELLAQGVEHRRVMDEGCWAPVYFDEVMPRRGVVLRLMRRDESITLPSAEPLL